MKIGIIGTRGIPNNHGGFEQFAEFIAPGLVQRGHEVFVYNSSLHPFKEKKWRGVNIITRYDPENKIGTAGQFIYDFNCIVDTRKRDFDVILQLGYTSSSIWSFFFPQKACIITNMDGLEWKRSKYSAAVRKFLKRAEKWAVFSSHYLIADSKGIQEYLLQKYHRDSFFIPYGAELVTQVDESLLAKKNLKKETYNLLIARMEPENNIETIIKGHLLTNSLLPLIIIGSYTNRFGTYLKKTYASDKIVFFGPIYDLSFLNSLRFYSNLYFHGHSVGGTNPSLLEAMASHALIAAHDNVFNRTVLGDDAFYFSTATDIADLIKQNLRKSHFNTFIKTNDEKIKHLYGWDKIINQLEKYLLDAIFKSPK
jgi:glycosyltransferase involved in cell wall biosynthesis